MGSPWELPFPVSSRHFPPSTALMRGFLPGYPGMVCETCLCCRVLWVLSPQQRQGRTGGFILVLPQSRWAFKGQRGSVCHSAAFEAFGKSWGGSGIWQSG